LIELRLITGIGQAVKGIEQRIDAVVVFLDDQAVLVTGILPLRYQVPAAIPFPDVSVPGTPVLLKNPEAVASHAFINLVNHSFLGMVGFIGFYQM
jgi:hypothetical protein